MLSPCYKRLCSIDGGKREADHLTIWKQRLQNTLEFFRTQLLLTHSVIALQEVWTHSEYIHSFLELAASEGHELHLVRRHESRKEDALGLFIKKDILILKKTLSIPLCDKNDRIGWIVWLYHKPSKKNILITNTHLSFPHNEFDRQIQKTQIRTLLESLNRFAISNNIQNASRIVLGDLNVETNSDVCDYLRQQGYSSVMDISPPINGLMPSNTSLGFPLYHRSVFVSHRTHRYEDLGVDHIFYKAEHECHDDNDDGNNENINTKIENDVYNISPSSSSLSSSSPPSSPCLFVAKSAILPTELSASKWHSEKEFNISDHRPVSTTMIFGRKATKAMSSNTTNSFSPQ